MVAALDRHIADLTIARTHLALAAGADLTVPESGNRKSGIVNPSAKRKAGKRKSGGTEPLPLETERAPSGSVSAEYRKMMHPELVPEAAAPRAGRYTPEALQIIDAMRVIAEPFTAADLGRATGGEADFANHIYRALKRGWIIKQGRGSYVRAGAFPTRETRAT